MQVNITVFDAKLRVSKVAVCCFSWGICYDFYRVKTAAGGFNALSFHSSVFYQATLEDSQLRFDELSIKFVCSDARDDATDQSSCNVCTPQVLYEPSHIYLCHL
jgi:hypothetical protein